MTASSPAPSPQVITPQVVTPQVITMGCRLNAYESEQMQNALLRDGQDAIVINSCAVTNEAVRQTRQTIRKLRREHPDKRIILTGCAAELEPESFAAMPELNQVIGNADKLKSGIFTKTDQPIIHHSIMEHTPATEAIPTYSATRLKARAFVQVQTGCNHRCTFCIIPYGRGASRSIPAGQVITQIKSLVASGVKEVVLCGVDLTAYGQDLPVSGHLGHLVGQILKLVPDLPHLRLSSVDCSELDPELKGWIVNEPRLLPHLHLSLQSGDPMILKRMKRRHTPEQALELVEELRGKRPELVFGADIITGFPTEDEAMFANSLAHLQALDILWLHVFPYSARNGTPAARIPKQIPKAVRKARAKILRQWADEQAQRHYASKLGTQETVLIETNNKGHSRNFAPIKINGEALNDNHLVKVRYTGYDETGLIAVPIVTKEATNHGVA